MIQEMDNDQQGKIESPIIGEDLHTSFQVLSF
jgi:hypothetical protein